MEEMLKYHKKLRKLWRNCEVLTMIAGQQLTTKAFDKELIRVIQKDMMRGDKYKALMITLRNLAYLKIKQQS